jgi:hypothetical protein
MEVIKWIQEHLTDVIAVVSSVVAAASLITALTPTPKDDGIVKKVKDFLNLLALNVGGAKPEDK